MVRNKKTKRRKKKGGSSALAKFVVPILLLVFGIIVVGSLRGCSDFCENPTHRSKFEKSGTPDSMLTNAKSDTMKMSVPAKLSFFMESSGSMNGFLRGGVPTDFKKDVWEIMNYYTNLEPTVNVLTADNQQLKVGKYDLNKFQLPFNNGGFVNAVSTNLPDMIRYICNTIDIENEVAIFISDMQFDPVGQAAPAVLQAVYSTDIAKIFGVFNNAVSLIGAKSNYVYRDGTTLEETPYYFLLLGKAEKVAFVRNDISELLSENEHFIDNIETGFNYKTVPYEYERIKGCQRLNEMALHGIDSGSCSFDLLLHLENYRWNMCDKELLKQSLVFESENGCNISIDSILYDIETTDPATKSLNRKVTAHVKLSVSNMVSGCDIIRWKMDVPVIETKKFEDYFTDTPNNPALTYSLDSFIKGMFKNGTVSFWNKDYNYLHLSKE